MMTNNNNTLKYRVDQLEKRYDGMDKKIDSILTNHLPHIQNDITKMRSEQRLVGALIIGSGIVAFILQRIWG
jgi:hypothetical protein